MAGNGKFDIVVFGATGFTGARVCRYLAGRDAPSTKIAIAGRNKEQLQKILNELNVSWGVIAASYEVPSSIDRLADCGRIIINCVGPYRHFGLALPKACIRAHADYLDVCGEPEFLERTQFECHDSAIAAESLIIGSCGFDSVPSDLGAQLTYEQLSQKGASAITSIECFVSFRYGQDGISIHYPTYESAIHGMANVSNLKQIRRKLHSQNRLKSQSKVSRNVRLSKSKAFSFDSRLQKWVVPFPAADASVIRRSFQGLKNDSIRPDISVFLTVSSFIWALIISFWGALVMLLSRISFARYLLLQYPYLFSLGTITKSGPSEKQMNDTSFEINIYGQAMLNDSKIIKSSVRISGPEPGYVSTPILVAEAAFVLLSERKNLKFQGGVFTPALAFQGSSFVKKLTQAGIRIDVLE